MYRGRIPLEVKQYERQLDCSSPSSAAVKNEWNKIFLLFSPALPAKEKLTHTLLQTIQCEKSCEAV